ncbi:MAG TPA: metal ABC transporter permease [Ktedonobacteraceae bacterium]
MNGTAHNLLLATAQPFSWNLVADVQQMLAVDFMRTSFLAGSLIAVTCGLVGYYVLLRRLIFASDALSHVGFAGAMAAAFLGWNPFVGLFGGSIIVGIGMGQLGRTSARSRDIAVGTVLAWILGLGALFLGLYLSNPVANTNIAVGVGVLFGSIFGIDPQAALVISLVGTATSLVLLAIARPLLFASLDPEVARARGLPVRLLDALFLTLLAVTVAEAVPAVGALLVFALIVTPAASARKMVTRPYIALMLSGALALVITWAGLTMAFYLSYPVSFDISALGFVVYLLVLAFQQMRAMTRRRLERSAKSVRG